MLNPMDDYPIHQTSEPIAHPASASRNHFDRYFFNGYDPDGELFFAAALGVYPHRKVIDAAFSVVTEGVQRSINASGRAPLDRTDTRIGPIRVEVVEPLRVLRVLVDEQGLGLSADLTFTARSLAFAEPHFTLHDQTAVVFDYTRMTQVGAWQGTIEIDGTTVEIDPATHRGIRDRSWGVRPVGEMPEPGVPLTELPQLFWLWSPIDWGDHATHFSVNEDAEGRRWHQAGAIVPFLADVDIDTDADLLSPEPAFDPGGRIEPMRDVGYDLTWRAGTRTAATAQIELEPWHDDARVITLEPLMTFPMRGIGYLDSEWGHGRWKDELAVASRTWSVDALDPTDLANVHVQQLCRARDGERSGLGVFEQLAINEHLPTGLGGFTDGATIEVTT